MLSPEDIKRIVEIKESLTKITPWPWFNNGYSGIFSGPLTEEEYVRDENGNELFPPPKEKRPTLDQCINGEWSKEALEWFEAERLYYEAWPYFASVDPQYGDTATGTRRESMYFISDAPSNVSWLISKIEELQAELQNRAR